MNSELLKSKQDVQAKIDHAAAVIELLIIANDNEEIFVSNKIVIDALASVSESLSIARDILLS
ncbi:MAG: hypothetical protein [Bacteriophage sp.]|nr:MAG: hypothetical protein [Bacteriophage sp.]